MESKKSKKALKWVGISVLALALLGGCAIAWIYSVAGSRYAGEAVRVYIPRDATAPSIADTLKAVLGDEYGAKVAKMWAVQGGTPSVAHGSYAIEPGDRALDISRRLLHGTQTPVKVTFNNVRTMQQLADKVSAYMEFGPQDFLNACDSVLIPEGFTQATYPAAFLPDSYEFYWTASPENTVKKLLAVRNSFWTDERRAKAMAIGLRPVEVASLAAIVEEETAKADERGKVARLYLNRLQKGMLLQADPTVKYAVGDFGLRRITNVHLQKESPYNTYKHAGLTPGPIRIPAKSTLEAVLAAPQHDYLYMCAKEDFSGYHNFARDYSTHLANARRYQAELNRRNIR